MSSIETGCGCGCTDKSGNRDAAKCSAGSLQRSPFISRPKTNGEACDLRRTPEHDGALSLLRAARPAGVSIRGGKPDSSRELLSIGSPGLIPGTLLPFSGSDKKCNPDKIFESVIKGENDVTSSLRSVLESSGIDGQAVDAVMRAVARARPSAVSLFTGQDIWLFGAPDLGRATRNALNHCRKWLIEQGVKSQEYKDFDCGECDRYETVGFTGFSSVRRRVKCTKTLEIEGDLPCTTIYGWESSFVDGSVALFSTRTVKFRIKCRCL